MAFKPVDITAVYLSVVTEGLEEDTAALVGARTFDQHNLPRLANEITKLYRGVDDLISAVAKRGHGGTLDLELQRATREAAEDSVAELERVNGG